MVPGNWISTCKKIKVDPSLTTYTKLIKHVSKIYCNVYTMELLEEYVDVHLCDPGLGNDFLYKTPKTQVITEKIGIFLNWTSAKIENNCCASRTLLRKWKDNLQNEIKYL